MPIVPTSARAVIVDEVRNLIANCATFITATGSADYVAAKSRVHLVEAFPDFPPVTLTTYKRPLALVLLATFEYRISKPGYPFGMQSFQLEIDAIATVDGIPATPEQQAIDAMNFFGGIESEISQLGSTVAPATNDALLRFDRINQVRPIERSRDTSDKDFWRARYDLQLF